jgi:uncharacterized protein YuzE
MTYDSSADAAYIYISEIAKGEAVSQRSIDVRNGEIILDFDKEGRLLGVEILGVSYLLKPEVVVSLGLQAGDDPVLAAWIEQRVTRAWPHLLPAAPASVTATVGTAQWNTHSGLSLHQSSAGTTASVISGIVPGDLNMGAEQSRMADRASMSVVESLPAHMRALFVEVIGAHDPVLLELLMRHEIPSNDERRAVETILSNEFSGELCQDLEPNARGKRVDDILGNFLLRWPIHEGW